LDQSGSHLSPDSVNVVVEGLKGKDLELGFVIVEEGEDAGR
jgi:hypothetical protein